MQQKLGQLFCRQVSRTFKRCYNSNSCLDISPVVEDALKSGRPIVALESTIITHGMPYPQNLQTALQVEETVRSQGAVPATIAIIEGRVKVGVDGDMLSELAMMKLPAVKTSRRDFPYVLSKGLHGGTTVSGTILVANLVGIKVFATGGIGGVHRGGEDSMDVSADLTELGRNPIAVVSSGVKSILDVRRTLEYLETQGVAVVTYGSTKNFPAFYSPQSGVEAPYNVASPREAAALLNSLLELRMSSGMLLAVPIPEEYALAGKEIESAIQKAVKMAEDHGIQGKEVTPFILKQVNELTAGKSLDSNIALVKNNAKVAAQLAVELHRLRGNRLSTTPTIHTASRDLVQDDSRPVVIGGCNMDCIMSIKEDNIKADGRTLRGEVRQYGGGVGRNLADALGKLGAAPLLVSAVGRDLFGHHLLQESLSSLDHSGVSVLDNARTACYSPVVDSTGECQFGIGDMDIHDHITPQMVERYESKIRRSPLVIMDGNIPEETIHYILGLCRDAAVPVWFEPTDLRKAAKPFTTDLWRTLSFISPNLNELRRMTSASGARTSSPGTPIAQLSSHEVLAETSSLARHLAEHINVVLVTLGHLGVMVVRKGAADDVLFQNGKLASTKSNSGHMSARLYNAPAVERLINVSGAGDCFAAGFIVAMLRGLPESRCAAVGTACAALALQTSSAVPAELPSNRQSTAWSREASYRQL